MEQLQQTLESRALELAYERTSREVEALYDTERLRQLRVHTLLLEDDKNDLHTQSAQDDDRIDGLERSNEQLQVDLEVCGCKLDSARGDLRNKSREIKTLKAELNSMHRVTMDSTRLLTEKLTLARELSALRSEVDRLRSLATSHQSLLAEKLSLQRQLSTVEVELEKEKRATQRALDKEGKSQAEDAKLEARLESLQADIAKERQERQKVERGAQKESIESDNKITTLESRLDAFRNKLKSTKDELKEAQASLHTAQSSNYGTSSRASALMKSTKSLVGNPRKRAAAQIDTDTIIGTPRDVPAAKKSRRGSTLVGEKSTFSITPFLNRTASVAPESPPSDNASGVDEEYFKASDHLSASRKQKEVSSEATFDLMDKSDATKEMLQANKPGILETAKTGKINSRVPPARKMKAAPTLEQVAEENNENGESTTSMSEPAGPKGPSNETFDGNVEMKRRKKKLLRGGLGKTLFDEDEGDALRGDRGVPVGVRVFGTLGIGGLGPPKFGTRKAIGPSQLARINDLDTLKQLWQFVEFMFPRRSRSGSKYSDLLFRPTLTVTCFQRKCQSRWALGGRSLLQRDGLSILQYSSSASSKRWQARQAKDRFAISAKVQGLKSRAAFKLLEINEKYKIFRGGQTIVDLGYAPGSWSQVAVDRTFPNGRVLGIDIIPAQPPKGVSTIQGNFLSLAVQEEVKRFLRESDRGRTKQEPSFIAGDGEDQMTEEDLEQSSRSYLELEKKADRGTLSHADPTAQNSRGGRSGTGKVDSGMVDVVLSDMSEPWEQTEGFWKRSLSDPYYRMMNTSGVSFRDHAGSMDLCDAALRFAFDTLRTGGHFVCKFYQGSEDKALELRLKTLFSKVHREKPESSRSQSKESYFVALRRRAGS